MRCGFAKDCELQHPTREIFWPACNGQSHVTAFDRFYLVELNSVVPVIFSLVHDSHKGFAVGGDLDLVLPDPGLSVFPLESFWKREKNPGRVNDVRLS